VPTLAPNPVASRRRTTPSPSGAGLRWV